MALSISQMNAITQELYIPKLRDNIFDSISILNRLMQKSGGFETYSGGTTVREPLLYAKTSAGGFFSGLDTLDTTDNDQFTAAEYSPAQAYANVTIDRRDELNNMGASQVLNLVQKKMMVAEKTIKDTIAENLVSDGTNADGMEGLEKGVATTGNSVGGIDSSTYSWWDPQVDTSTTTLTIAAMQSRMGACSIDTDQVTDIFTTQAVFNFYHALLAPQERFVNAKVADAGFKTLSFQGVPVIVDDQLADDHMLFLNLKYISFKTHADENFRFSGFQKPTDQNGKVGQIFWMGMLTYSNRRFQGAMDSITS